MKILVIEDEKLLADSIRSMLERKGFRVECVYDGESGKDYAELGIYDLLFCYPLVVRSLLFLGFCCCFSQMFITRLWGSSFTSRTCMRTGRPWTE